MKVFPFSVDSNGLSCYKTGFHQIRYALNVCYLCVRLQAALIHFDGAVLFAHIFVGVVPNSLQDIGQASDGAKRRYIHPC